MDAGDALDRWVSDGLIPAELAGQLRASLETYVGPRKTSNAIRVLVFVGSLLIGGGLLLFIASQWGEQSPTFRLILLVGIYAAVVGAAALADWQRLETTASGLWFVASITAGVNIFLIGQIFNLPLNYWQGTLLWLIVTLAMGWASPSLAQGWLAAVLFVLTLGWVSVPSSRFFDQWAFLWESSGVKALLPLVGLALISGSVLVKATDFEFLLRPARSLGALLIAVPITVSTFHPEAFVFIFRVDFRVCHAVVIFASGLVLALGWFRRPNPLLGYTLVVVGAVLAALLPQVVDSNNRSDTISWLADPFQDSELLFGIYTAVIFALALVAIIVGQKYRVPALVNAGITIVAVLTISIYIGRLAGALPTSIAVLLGGVLLVGGAVFLERKRRDLLLEVSR
jgi:uncharacterized membrane protein